LIAALISASFAEIRAGGDEHQAKRMVLATGVDLASRGIQIGSPSGWSPRSSGRSSAGGSGRLPASCAKKARHPRVT
jgi:hypothetical protein